MTSNAPLWEQKLRSMVEYHATNLGKGGAYAPYLHTSGSGMLENAEPNAKDTTGLSDEAKAVLKDHGTDLISKHKTAVDKVQAGLEKKLINDTSPDKPDWVDTFKDTGKKLEENSIKAIQETTTQLIEVTWKLPEKMRAPTANLWSKIVDKFTKFWRDALVAVVLAVNSILEWIKEAWEMVKAGFEKAGKFFKAAASWVVDLFS